MSENFYSSIMLTFFDFLYYSIYKLYNEAKDGGSEFAASCAIAGLQSFNISSAIFLYGIIVYNNGVVYASKIFAGILIVTLIALNYIRYIWIKKFHYEVIREKLELKSLKYRKRNRLFQIIYLLGTITLFFSLVFYLASKKM